MRKLFALSLLLALPLLASCANQGNLDALNARVMQHERQINQLSSQVGSVEQVLPGQAEMWAQMQAMRQELNSVRGQLDENQMRAGASSQSELSRLKAAMERLEIALRQMASELGMNIEALNAPAYTAEDPDRHSYIPGAGEPGGAPPVYGAPGAAPEAARPPEATPPPLDTATALYDAGMKAFSDRRYNDAVIAFNDFATTFPNHQLTSNAYFWKGESHYQLKDYGAAALAYQQVLEKFPGSNKFQSAMLKQGMSFYYANRKDAAKLRLEDLVKRYPGSPEAGRAKQFLQDNK
jgi:tol-pal system protein YbgF